MPAGQAWEWNQTLMDLGATVCRPVPRCAGCPLAPSCAWTLAGRAGPDPARGSAGVSVRQAPFQGSDRQARGRLLAALVTGPLECAAVPSIMGRDAPKAAALLADLVDEHLVVSDAGVARLA